MAISSGKKFEDNFKDSVKATIPKVFYMRIKDNQLSFQGGATSQNPYDCIVFDQGYLFTLELKSTKSKSLGFAETIVKQHQIDNLLDANTYKDVISGFLINFREQPENKLFFIHIEDYVKYKNVAEGRLEWTYKSKINKASLPIGIAEEIGLEITGKIKRVNYKYDIKEFIEAAIKRNHARLWIKGETG